MTIKFGERSQNGRFGNAGETKRCTYVIAGVDDLLPLLLGKTPKETFVMLVRVYEDQALSMKCGYKWLARFEGGRESVSDTLAESWRSPEQTMHQNDSHHLS
ncbi:hypothetical protein TNCV_5116221 [Trichonephila clavipes]|nr:hypothetical protein TNCV_5116221 [Trichonephila clavipes]